MMTRTCNQSGDLVVILGRSRMTPLANGADRTTDSAYIESLGSAGICGGNGPHYERCLRIQEVT